jgi:hypothetical protein
MIVSASTSVPSARQRRPAHLRDPGGDEVHVRFAQRRVEVVGDQHPLAPERVVGGELAAQVGVGDLPGEVLPRAAFGEPEQPRVERQPEHVRLTDPVVDRAGEALGDRPPAEQPPFEPGQLPVGARHDPRRGALEDGEVAASRWTWGTNWIADAPVPTMATRGR